MELQVVQAVESNGICMDNKRPGYNPNRIMQYLLNTTANAAEQDTSYRWRTYMVFIKWVSNGEQMAQENLMVDGNHLLISYCVCRKSNRIIE